VDTNETTIKAINGITAAQIGARRVVIHRKPYKNASKNINRPARISVYTKRTDIMWTPRDYKLSDRNIERVTRAAESVGIMVLK
jgi:hypothetical protein